MRKKLFTTLMLLCIAAVSAWAYFANIDGKWTGGLTYNGESVPLTYTFKADGDKLTGNAETSYGNSTVDNGKITGDSFTFTTTVSGAEIPHSGKVFADSIALDIDIQGTNYHTTLKRAK